MVVQWVPSHVGMHGNECADQNAAKGARIAQREVLAHKEVTDIWEDLGLEEVPDSYDSDSNQSGGSNISDESRGEGVCDDSDEIFCPKIPFHALLKGLFCYWI